MSERLIVKQQNGIIASIIIDGDANNMNWIYKDHEWGKIFYRRRADARFKADPIELVSFEDNGDNSIAVFANRALQIAVRRTINQAGSLTERYTFKNISNTDLFIQTGELGIIIPIADCYTYAADSLRKYCNAHINCAENCAWINALRQGNSDKNLGLVVTEGSINKYSQLTYRTGVAADSPRGDFILHPEACELLCGEEFSIEWEIFAHKGTEDFHRIIAEKQKIRNISADKYTVFSGEKMDFRFETNETDVTVSLNGESIPYARTGNVISVSYLPKKFGDHHFDIYAGKYKTHIQMFATLSFDELVRQRVEYIVDNQQYHRQGSDVDGAYLVYDNDEERMVYDNRDANHNAARERLGMGLLVARYLQKHKDAKIYASIMQYVEFIKRELFDTETGEVFNTVGKNRSYIRLYNAPWVMQFFAEMYMLTKEYEYIEYIHKALNFYYSNGGLKFYPNAIRPLTVYNAIVMSENNEYANEALKFFVAHADQMLSVGLNYPPHEVVYEQTIVTPAVCFICEVGIITGDKKYLDGVQGHLECLDRFSGTQPDCRLNDIPIRYWDGYWFGKSMLYGDTFPHYWSCLSADAWDDYYMLSGNEKYKQKAENCIRNCMTIYDEVGKGSCAYMYPFYIDNTPAQFNDGWSNDQDYAMYYLLRIVEEGNYGIE